LIKEFIPTAINQLWVSDITYWKIQEEFLYISFITDAYSHKIVGYQVAEPMEAIESIKALQMALSVFVGTERHLNLIHHSDRGIQYCSYAYVNLLQGNNRKISMTENGDPLENAIAERINGIIKKEYLETYDINNIRDTKELLKVVVDLYNNERPHMGIGNLTPNQTHKSLKPIKKERLWKNYYQKKFIFVNQEQV
jgi:putative transposase